MKHVIKVGVTTTKGNYRSINEDNFFFAGKFLPESKSEMSLQKRCKTPMLFAVIDGMGGSNYGKEATHTAISYFKENYKDIISTKENQIITEIDIHIKRLNMNVNFLEQKGKKTGCTLAFVYVENDRYYIANVGDSRIYRFSDEKLIQLSVDHNEAQAMIYFGLKKSGNSIRKNVLTQYIGMSPEEVIIEPYVNSFEYDHSILFLCSDGINEALSNESICEIISTYKNKNLKKATKYLVSKAIERGAKDNLTAMLIKLY